jgi:transcriptional regulator with XRE-family HTH domain
MVGVRLRAARLKIHKTIKEVAARLGVSPARMKQYELGTREITLPELEELALYFQVPISHFLASDTVLTEELPPAPSKEELAERRAFIGARLKQARLAAGKSKEDCAALVEQKPARITRYERGRADVPITELERLAEFLGVNIFYFLASTPRVGEGNVLDLEYLARLPKDLRAFVFDPASLPYLRMAAKFRDLPADKLKELGELLLVVR